MVSTMWGRNSKHRGARAVVLTVTVLCATACASVSTSTDTRSLAAGPADVGFFQSLFGTPDQVQDSATERVDGLSSTQPDTGASEGDVDTPKVVEASTSRKTGILQALFGTSTASDNGALKVDARDDIVQASLSTSANPRDLVVKRDVPFGTDIAYGSVVRLCGVPDKRLGKKIAQYPEKAPLYRLYDSDTKSKDPRSFYVTGFADGCVRQFTAALAVFGSVRMHEMLRYGLPAEVQPYSETDKAYEKLKRQICGKPRRKPCGPGLSVMEQDTVFLSVYERFDSNIHWMNLLLHRGQILAEDHKEGVADG